jgi:tetratricopeptide (TPR) repeat protein
MSLAPSHTPRTQNPTTGQFTDDAPKTQRGATLLSEAEGLVEERQWRRATKVLDAAKSVGCDSPRLHELMAVAANHAGKREAMRVSLDNLRGRENQTASSALALARVALTNRQFGSADTMARQALAADPYSTPAWYQLAASYCALGWFEEAQHCLDAAGNEPSDPNDRWYLGRAINHWAMSRTQTILITVIAVLLFGTIGMAVGLAVPFVTREVRLANLPESFRQAASDAWKTEHRLRITIALAVLAVVVISLAVPQWTVGN